MLDQRANEYVDNLQNQLILNKDPYLIKSQLTADKARALSD
jgi:hypothetical protein